MNPHRIRLRDPWLREPSESGAVWRRKFGRPAGLGPDHSLWIVMEDVRGPLCVRMNGENLGQVADRSAGRFEVTGRLLARNELTILLEGPLTAGAAASLGPPASVCLEIELGSRGFEG